MKKVSLGITVGLMALTAAATFVVTSNLSLDRFNEKIKSVNEKQEFYNKLSEIDTYVRTHYINEIDESKLIEGMVGGYIGGLGDSYAEYISAESYAARTAEQSGVVEGLGIEYEPAAGGYIGIKDIQPGGAAEEAGLQVGDIITAVNNVDVLAFSGGYEEAVSYFSCPEGTRVRLYIKRTEEDGTSNFINYDVVSMLTEKSTVTGRMAEGFAYIRISSFTDRTEMQLKSKLDELISAGAAGIIFDVRGNKGGSVESLQSCLDHILGAGDIVTATYMNGTSATVVTCTEAEKIKMPMSVIVDRETAGTAELFAFALAENAGAHTVGKTTAGKGYLQTAYTCSDGTVVMLSTAVLTTANSGNFNGTGLKPEFDTALSENVDLNNISEEASMLTDSQLIKAIEVTGMTAEQ